MIIIAALMKNIIQNKQLFGIVFWLWFSFILIISLIPNIFPMEISVEEQKTIRLDYLFHFIAYGILGLFFLLWKSDKEFRLPVKTIWIFLIGGFLLASLSELSQLFIPGRSFNPYDFISNNLGVLAGGLLPRRLLRKLF